MLYNHIEVRILYHDGSASPTWRVSLDLDEWNRKGLGPLPATHGPPFEPEAWREAWREANHQRLERRFTIQEIMDKLGNFILRHIAQQDPVRGRSAVDKPDSME
jgi:hypothetical protein